ncbi:MAG: hypothetical protein ABJO54_04875, partial [Hyphomicrobiales bacterium]
ILRQCRHTRKWLSAKEGRERGVERCVIHKGSLAPKSSLERIAQQVSARSQARFTDDHCLYSSKGARIQKVAGATLWY